MAKKTTSEGDSKKMGKVKLTMKPKVVVQRLLKVLPERARDIVTKRYGLGNTPERMTLEAIGEIYGVTRERVRQIENYSLSVIRKSDEYTKEEKAFEELEKIISSLGTVVPEEDLLESIARDKSTQNHIHFLLVLGSIFTHEKENEDFGHRWHVSNEHASSVESALKRLYENLSDDDLIPESEMISRFLENIKDTSNQYRDEEIVKRWLSLSKKISRNPLGEYGKANSSNVNLKGIRDYAYLVIREHGSPMHFTEVAKQITNLFNREAHVATCHNELIKDDRFVLVGRGLYALSEWGYLTGVVKDVIKEILKKHGPLTRDEIVEQVLKERYVKSNTVLVNLQDAKHFKRMKDGKYTLV